MVYTFQELIGDGGGIGIQANTDRNEVLKIYFVLYIKTYILEPDWY
jgi:hypothetical protein